MTETKKKIEQIATALIEEEYITHNEDEDDELYWCKEALKQAITPLERKIYITYLEQGSYAAASRCFKVCVQTFKKYINKLKAKIANYVCEHID